MGRTKLHPALCWVIGWSHVAHAAVLILSFGFLSTGLPLAVSIWACRLDQKWRTPNDHP